MSRKSQCLLQYTGKNINLKIYEYGNQRANLKR